MYILRGKKIILVYSFSTEIRQLDSERQSLVYNHHHELIAASDTIAAVRPIVRIEEVC